MPSMPDKVLRWLVKPFLFVACLVPFLMLLHGVFTNQLGADPVKTVEHATGDWALRLLLATLAMTPLRMLTRQTWPIRLRRMLGLFAFFYASVHFLAWLGLDEQFRLSEILSDIAKRPYVTVGFLAWLLMLPLAMTSNRWSMRRLGRDWSRLHRAIYLIAPLGVLHFLWLVKADLTEPLIYGGVLGLLLLFRVPQIWRKRRQGATRPWSGGWSADRTV